MSDFYKSPEAESIPFDPKDSAFSSRLVGPAIRESLVLAEGKPRAFIYFWEWNTNATPKYFYKFGQVRSDVGPFVIAQESKLREFTCGGKLNNVTANASFTLYKNTTGIAPTTFGTRATAVNQGLTYLEWGYPITGVPRVAINLLNNGPSLPLSFSENTLTSTVNIQLATGGSGNITTTATQLRAAFRLNKTITLLYAINGTGGTLSAASFSTAGGVAYEEMASVFMRAQSFGVRIFETTLFVGDFIYLRNDNQNVASVGNPDAIAYISFGVG